MKKQTILKKFSIFVMLILSIVTIYTFVNIYKFFSLLILYFKIRFIFEDTYSSNKEKMILINIILKYIFINDIKVKIKSIVEIKSICKLRENDCEYNVVLNDKYYMIINMNSKFVIKCEEKNKNIKME